MGDRAIGRLGQDTATNCPDDFARGADGDEDSHRAEPMLNGLSGEDGVAKSRGRIELLIGREGAAKAFEDAGGIGRNGWTNGKFRRHDNNISPQRHRGTEKSGVSN